MKKKQNFYKMICLTSVAVLLGACSSTPDVEPEDSSRIQTVMKQQPLETITPVKPKAAVVKRKATPAKPVVVKRKAYAPPKPIVVATRKPAPRKAYVPPKPIVVAVHNASKPRSVRPSIASTKRAIASNQRAAMKNPALRRPSLPRTAAPMIVASGAPVIRPATVPTSRSKQAVYVAPRQPARRTIQNQQQARLQQVRQQQTRQQQARLQQARAQQLRVQQQQARQQQARQQQARVQQARVQQASFQPQIRSLSPQRPANNYSQRRLTGDFAGNPRAEAFIRMMASRHGFDPSYTTGVLSRAKATPWLRKQARKDANPIKSPRGRGPSWSNYRRRFITSKHINTGSAFYNRHQRSLQRAENQYGVPAEYILGIMGVETIYGGNVGTDKAIDALATMGFMNSRRGKYFTSELESYLVMTRRARLDPLKPKASWAGALGLPQFMPSNIKKYGVDYDGDGAVNLWTPADAIGSIANYLRSHGWKPGEIAAIPATKTGGKGYSRLKSGFKYKHSLSKLARNGLRPAYPGVSGMVNMVKLRTNRGQEYWVGGNNFYVITRYNHSSHYAMAVHQLAQEIRKRVMPGRRSMPRVIEASADQNLLMQAANSLL